MAGRPARSTTKIVSLTTSAHVAPPAASAWPTFWKVRRACASQSPAGAEGSVGGDRDLTGGPHEPAGRGQAHDVAVAGGR